MTTHTPVEKSKENKSNSVANEKAFGSEGITPDSSFVDNRTESNNQNGIHQLANNSRQAVQLKSSHDLANESEQSQEAIQMHSIANGGDEAGEDNGDQNKNKSKTGIPDQLKSGIEKLSGLSMDDVKVHRNSPKPAQLQAQAYAQGSDIHLASGQEKHLAHEAWHVVQQKQGRVQPTTQLKGKFDVNDDSGLEKEADVMGAKAMKGDSSGAENPVQMKKNDSGITSQSTHQLLSAAKAPNDGPAQLVAESTPIGNEIASAEDKGDTNTMAFLAPNTAANPAAAVSPGIDKPELGNQSAPVHLTKNVKTAEGLAKINAANVHGAEELTHKELRKSESVELNEHFTLTSGFMTAALLASPIKSYIVKNNPEHGLWNITGVDTQVLSQNKLMANTIVDAFNSELDLAATAKFDNLMFVYAPDGEGPTFDQVVSFHDAVSAKLNATPEIPDLALPFEDVSYTVMRNQIVSGADALAAQWKNWGGKSKGSDPVTRNDFRIEPSKWTDLSKAADILNRMRVKALQLTYMKGEKIENSIFDEVAMDADFVNNSLFGAGDGNVKEKAAITKDMASRKAAHEEEFTSESPRDYVEARITNHAILDLNDDALLKHVVGRIVNFPARKVIKNTGLPQKVTLVENDDGAKRFTLNLG